MVTIQKLIQKLSRLILPIFFKIETKNQNRALGLKKPLIILSNHKSYADHFILAASFPDNAHLFPIRPVAKAPLFEHLWGFTRKIFEALGAIPHTKALRAIKILKEGGVILIYPEGGIRKSPGIHNLEAGTAFLAIKTNAWILPIAIIGLDNFSLVKTLLNPLNIFRKRCVTVSFGDAFKAAGSQNQDHLTSEIKIKLKALYEPPAA